MTFAQRFAITGPTTRAESPGDGLSHGKQFQDNTSERLLILAAPAIATFRFTAPTVARIAARAA